MATKRDSRLTGINPLAYIGDNAYSPPNLTTNTRAPTANDRKNFYIGDIWIDTSTSPENVWMLVKFAGAVATWLEITTGVTPPWTVPQGGTGQVTLTDHGILVGAGVNPITSLAEASDGQLIVGSTGNNPALATLTAGVGIGITNAAGSITVSSSGGGLSWVDVTGTTQAMAVDTGYLSHNAALVTLTLPATAAFGSIVRIAGLGAGGWKLAQNAGQVITWDSAAATTVGVGGSLDSTDDKDCVEILCIVANTNWLVLSSKGNISIT